MHCVASRFGYPNCRLSEISLVPISSDNRRSTVFYYLITFPTKNGLCWVDKSMTQGLLEMPFSEGKNSSRQTLDIKGRATLLALRKAKSKHRDNNRAEFNFK